MARIMIVDDAVFMRKMLGDIVTKAGHEIVAEAGDGNEAVSVYKKFKPDVVTMDITMPNKNGIEAVTEIVQEFPDAKIIMCSAMGQQAMVLDAIKAGAKDFIVKPFNGDKIIETIKKLTE